MKDICLIIRNLSEVLRNLKTVGTLDQTCLSEFEKIDEGEYTLIVKQDVQFSAAKKCTFLEAIGTICNVMQMDVEFKGSSRVFPDGYEKDYYKIELLLRSR